MIEDIKVSETEQETSTIPVDSLIVDTLDAEPKEVPDYSLTFPETAELVEEPKHFGRLAMWRKLRQLTGSLINALERIENWTEYLFGKNGKLTSSGYVKTTHVIDMNPNSAGKHTTTIANIDPSGIPLSVNCQTDSFNNLPATITISHLSVSIIDSNQKFLIELNYQQSEATTTRYQLRVVILWKMTI